jgi:lysylphosphatidylglycerol synthase-like protein
MTPSRARAIGILSAVAGAILFVWSLKAVGVAAVIDDVSQLGAGFAAIVALGGLRHLVRAVAWRMCLDDPRTLSVGASLAAYISGDAVGNVTPFGALVSEPSKVLIVRDRVTPEDAGPALAVENLFYSATVVVMLIAGTAALLVAFDIAPVLRMTSVVVVGCAIAAAVAGGLLIATRCRIVSGLAARMGIAADQIRNGEARVFDFRTRHPDRLWTIAALETTYHLAAVFEVWLALRLITGSRPALLTAFVLECINRTITVAFQFVPMWLGVDEAGTGLMTTALGIGAPVGVALALARKARVAIWTAIGLLLIGIRHRRTVVTPTHDENRHRRRDRIPWTST